MEIMKDFVKFVKEHSFNVSLLYSMNALTGELGELANVVKKEMIYDMVPQYAKRVDKGVKKETRLSFRDQFIDESGDTLFYFIQALNERGVTIDEVISAQIIKMDRLSLKNNKIYKK